MYVYALLMGREVCDDGARLFADDKGLKKLFELGNDFVKMKFIQRERVIG